MFIDPGSKTSYEQLVPPSINLCNKKNIAFLERVLYKLSPRQLPAIGSKDLYTQKELALLEKLLYRLLSQILPIDYFLKGRVFSSKR